MTTQEAIDFLRPFNPIVPQVALKYVRLNWVEAEPILLGSLDHQLTHPAEADDEALPLYALHLCAEMKTRAAFPRYLALCRLPSTLLGFVLGDVLTEGMPQMLARTCHGRIGELKGLAEDRAADEFSRSSGMRALFNLHVEDAISRDDLIGYCRGLLDGGLEPFPSNIWSVVACIAADLHAGELLPLIERAYANGWVEDMFQSLESIQETLAQSREAAWARAMQFHAGFRSTDLEMAAYATNWDNGPIEPQSNTASLLDILRETPSLGSQGVPAPQLPLEPRVVAGSKVGRNEPCPCGSGKKFKKCCINKPRASENIPVNVPEHAAKPAVAKSAPAPEHTASNWMEAGYRYLYKSSEHKAFDCWKESWELLRGKMPRDPKTPGMAEAFDGDEPLGTWIIDFLAVIESLSGNHFHVLDYGLCFCRELSGCFPEMEEPLRSEHLFALAKLEARMGQGKECFQRLENQITNHPAEAKGYTVLADLLSFDARKYNLMPDLDRAEQLILAVLEKSENGSDSDLKDRLEYLQSLKAKWR